MNEDNLHYAEFELENTVPNVMFVSCEFNNTYFLFSGTGNTNIF
jgi:hypothetical protein